MGQLWSNIKIQKILLALLVFIGFGLSLKNGYSLDDNIVTTETSVNVAKGLSGIDDILSSPYGKNPDGVDVYEYRPVTMITFAIEKALFGFKPSISHFINLLIYLGIVLLVFKIIKELFRDVPTWIPFFILAVFVVHPLHSEVVVSIKNREELLVSLFGYSAMWYSLQYTAERKWKYILFIALALVIGVNTKASFVPFILAIPFTLVYFKRISPKVGVGLFLSFFAVCSLAYLTPRSLIEQDLSRAMEYYENPLFFMSATEQLPMAFHTFLLYVKLHIVPYPLLSYYGFSHVDIVGWGSYTVYLGILILLIILVGILYFFKKNQIISFGLIYFLIFIIPVLNFPFPVAGIIAERFTFNSVLGFSMVLWGLVSYSIYNKTLRSASYKLSGVHKKYIFTLLFTVLIVFLAIDLKRTREWESFLTLMQTDAVKARESVKLQIMYGDVLQLELANVKDPAKRKEYIDEAMAAYKRAIDLYPQDGGVYNNLGVVSTLKGDYKKAILYLEKAIVAGEDGAENYYNLGACYEITGNRKEALKNYKIALKEDGNYVPARERVEQLNIQ